MAALVAIVVGGFGVMAMWWQVECIRERRWRQMIVMNWGDNVVARRGRLAMVVGNSMSA
jgi:hypothetical protein